MKKKILCLFILSFMFILPNSIEARSAEACSDKNNHAILQLNEMASGILGIKYAGIFEHSSTFYGMKLDNRIALCISKGDPAGSGNEYKIEQGSEIRESEEKALGFYLYGMYEGSGSTKWAIAQYVAWSKEIDDGFKDGENSPIARIIKLDNNNTISRKIASGQLQSILLAVKSSLVGAGGNFYVWSNQTLSDGQKLITTLEGCMETTTEDAICKKAVMTKTETQLICEVTKTGVSSETYDYSPGPSENKDGRTDVHIEYGEERALSGNAFCRLYCKENGTATLPGAFGEKLQLGSYMIWPTSTTNYNSKFYAEAYPLKFEGQLICHIGIIPDADDVKDSKMPFSCDRDPVGEYTVSYVKWMDIYNSTSNDSNTKTYYRIDDINSLEKLRKKYINDNGVPEAIPTENDVENFCKSIYTETEYATENQYALGDETTEETVLWHMKQANGAMEEAIKDQTMYCTGTTEGNAANPSCVSAQAAYDAAIADSNNWNDRSDTINIAIGTCKKYIIDFETMRQIILTYKECADYVPSTSLYEFFSTASFTYSDVGYSGVHDVDLDETTESIEMSSYQKGLIDDKFEKADLGFGDLYKQEKTTDGKHSGTLDEKVESIGNNKFTITKTETYSLSTDYKYLDKNTLNYTTTPPEANENHPVNYISFDKSIIPSSYKNEINYPYKLILTNVSFGMAGFNVATEYSCPVEFTNSRTPDTCVCPEGTANEGKDLTCLIADGDTTCPDAQVQYCEDTSQEIPEECGGNLYCLHLNDNISLSSCINSGKTYNWCKDNYCPGADDIKCPETTYGSTASNMDEQLRDCVQVKMAQGIDKTKAIQICEPLVCPGTRRIIYRTIKLENPFPSYDADTTVTQTNLTVGMFNNSIKGRYPGSNWNGILTVYNKIRNNRGTPTKDTSKPINTKTELVGTTIYQKKKPLYTFVLNGSTIKEIRDYNDKQDKGYNDFNLKCQINNSTACVSSFVHDSLYGLTGGECQNVSKQKSSFYSCARR